MQDSILISYLRTIKYPRVLLCVTYGHYSTSEYSHELHTDTIVPEIFSCVTYGHYSTRDYFRVLITGTIVPMSILMSYLRALYYPRVFSCVTHEH